MIPSCRATRVEGKSSVKVATQLAIIVLLFGLAECASVSNGLMSLPRQRGTYTKKINTKSSRGTSSCLSYGHSCWGAHGKRSGSVSPDAGSDGIAAALQQASPEDTRWFLSKLVGGGVGGGGGGGGGERHAAAKQPRGSYKLWERLDAGVKDDTDRSIDTRDAGSRSEVIRVDDDVGEFPTGGDDVQESAGVDGETVLLMASPADEIRTSRGSQKIRLYKILNRAARKTD